jgi:hypothetical protein
VSAQLRFLEYRLPIDAHLKSPAAGADQLQLGVGEPVPNVSRQTGGSRLVVSNDAILDADLHDDVIVVGY